MFNVHVKLEQERIQANLQKYHGDQQQTEPDSTATDDNIANENGSAAASQDITEEIRKAKEVAQSLAGKEVSDVFHVVIGVQKQYFWMHALLPGMMAPCTCMLFFLFAGNRKNNVFANMLFTFFIAFLHCCKNKINILYM